MEKRELNNLASTKLAGVGFSTWGIFKIAEVRPEIAEWCIVAVGVITLAMIISEVIVKLRGKKCQETEKSKP